jgi:hypothetical protein
LQKHENGTEGAIETMKLTKSYEQSAMEQRQAASSGFAAEITRLGGLLFTEAEAVQKSSLNAANYTRCIGMELTAWMNREQMKFEQFESFFRQHAAEIPDWLDSNAGRKCISAFKAHPEEITNLREAVHVMTQMTFFALGAMEEPTRLLPQTATGIGAFERLMSVWGKEREYFGKLKEEIPISKWSPEMWTTVFNQTQPAAELHAKAKEALKAA